MTAVEKLAEIARGLIGGDRRAERARGALVAEGIMEIPEASVAKAKIEEVPGVRRDEVWLVDRTEGEDGRAAEHRIPLNLGQVRRLTSDGGFPRIKLGTQPGGSR